MSTLLPSSLPNKRAQQPHASFKAPKLDTPNWSGKSCEFYPWLSAILSRFTITRAKNVVKVALTLQTIPLTRQGPFNNITEWYICRTKLIEEFGSIDISGRDVNQTFDLLPRNEFVQEVAEDLSPKIKTLLANLELARSSTTRRTSTALSSPRH